MLRTLKFSTHRRLSSEDTHRALEIARIAAAAAERVRGVRSCTSYADPEVLVIAAECDGCRHAEEALQDPSVRFNLDRLAAEYGYMMCEEEFLVTGAAPLPVTASGRERDS